MNEPLSAAQKREQEVYLRTMVLDALAEACHQNALAHGFYADDKTITASLLATTYRESTLMKTHEQNMLLKRHALITSEVGEMTDAVRKPSDAHHISRKGNVDVPFTGEFTQEEEECADILIRVLDYAAFRGLRIGEAVVAKMEYNAGRPYMHGKRS